MPERRRKFSPEFREEAVKMVTESSQPIARVARELNIKEGTLGNWVNTYRREHAGEEPPLAISERARLRELEKEVRELRMKAEFLGKAAAFFHRMRAKPRHSTRDTSLRCRRGVSPPVAADLSSVVALDDPSGVSIDQFDQGANLVFLAGWVLVEVAAAHGNVEAGTESALAARRHKRYRNLKKGLSEIVDADDTKRVDSVVGDDCR